MTKPEQAGLREKLAAIEFWQGTDGDPEFPEDVYGGLPEDVIETLLALIESTCMEVRHDEHFKTHCVTCGKYNQYKGGDPEDEQLCQCE